MTDPYSIRSRVALLQPVAGLEIDGRIPLSACVLNEFGSENHKLGPGLIVRRKRLRHMADILCRMFCGWRLANSYRSLASLGSGTLRIDVLGGLCEFEGESIAALSIAGELQHWLHEELAAHGILPEWLSHAMLTARLSFSSVPPGHRATNECYLQRDGKFIRAAEFYRCAIACDSEIATNEAVYRSCRQDVSEWPESRP